MQHENVQSWFSRIASEFPGKVAIAVGPREVSYRELEERSNSLANFLLANGAAAGAPVAVLTNDRVRILTAALGILKAGCVFAPLDPQLPEKRREAMMSLLAPEWFLAESQLLHRVDDDWDELTDYESYFNPAKPNFESQPDDMCYVYFTSGSTGQPKAIAGRLKGIDHFIRWEIKTLDLGAGTRVSQILPPTFDGSLRDMFIPLCTGGTACAPEDNQALLETDKLIAWLDRERITVIHCVPSLLRSLLNAKLTADNFNSLQYVLLAGEPLLPADVKRWTNVFGERIQLINLYGTSETTMAKFAYFVKASDQERRTIPVGKPIEGAAAVVVDKRGRPCPRGVIGEIYIRTPYRTLGYYNQPELTSQSFIPNPFSNDPNDIVYKTGDLGRVLEDGNFEYLGRLDRQVKIRGNRVELAEVEDVLRGHPLVSDVAVVDREDSSGLNYLCAYVVLGHELDTGELQQLVSDHLPEYMVPSAFIVMESLPRTISGKVDRRALPAPGLTRAGMGEFVAPSTHVEKVLAGIWTEVLGIEQIGINDNFFRLGGHSLRATQILSRVRAALNVEVPLRSLFHAPTVAGLAALINTKLPAPKADQIKPGARPDPVPLSFSQQRLWFIDQLEPGTATYNLPLAVRLKGPLDVQALGRTLTEIIRRHEVLRTTFSVVGNNPIQVISDPFEISFTLVDLSSLAEAERETAAQTVIEREARRPFDLARGPLLRPVLIELAAQEHIALLTMHHIISDGWSEGVLVNELATLYDAYAQGKQSPLAELKVQYADYAVWQREWLTGDVLEEQMNYWREQLAGSSGVLELPTDHPRPLTQSYRGAQATVELDSGLTEKLRELSRREGVTLFMTLLSGWQTLLARYSGQWDLNVGTPIANRTRGEVEDVIGFFVNTLILRTQLQPEASFREQLQQVREVCLGAYAHQDVPFEMLVEELQPERHLSRSPLFQVMFALQNVPFGELQLRGLKLEPMAVEPNTAKFDLMLVVVETDTGLVGWCDYSTDLFAESTIARMLEHWRVLLEAAVGDTEQSLAELPLLTEAERRQVFEWNETAADYPRERSIDVLFAEQAARTPTAMAVEYEGWTLSYEELNQRANQLARYLRRLGVGPEVRVGLSMERSLELVVALLGIVKAGGAYVPLDREYPPERLRFMIEDAQLRLVLTNGLELVGFADETGVQVVDLTSAQEEISRESEAELASDLTAENLAYVIYTSGSTGTPKGVEVTHRAVLRLVLNTDYLQLTPADRVAQVANTSFDASTFEVWGALLNGATIVPLHKEITLDTELFTAALKSERISAMFLTTALFNQLAQTDPGAFSELRAVLFGGEAVDPRWVRAILHDHAPEQLLHVYGPTEVTTFSTWQLVEEVAADATTVPIGKPIANTEAYVLDESLQLVPVGVNGELYLGGDGLARGYLNHAELTAERFVPHAWARRAGERLYRTGDVVRYLSNGAIEFVGRRDAQVKVRGFRIELGEIESVLTQHPQVREAVAVVREPQPGNKQLLAYVVGEATVSELRRYLREKLPDYMVPQPLVKLDQLPLTANGKVDRQALPAPDRLGDDAEEGYVAPRTPEEELLAGIWAEVLEVEKVSVHDNFFDCGGHSLLATQVTSRIKTVFNVELPIRSLFERPTVAELAHEIAAVFAAVTGRDSAPSLVRISRDAPLPLSFAQQRLWFLQQLEPHSGAYNMLTVLQISGPLAIEAFKQSVNEIVRRHEVLRTVFGTREGEPFQIVTAPDRQVLATIDLRHLPGAERMPEAIRLATDEWHRPFDLAAGPLFKVTLMTLSEAEHLVAFTMHHIVFDGWSMGLLMRELTTLYESFSQNQPSPFDELSLQYADFANWQREWLRGEVLDTQLTYWKNKLAGAPSMTELPSDRPRPATQTYRGASLLVAWSKTLADALKELSKAEGATLFMTLLAAFNILLYRYTNRDDILVGTDVANRNRREVEPLLGFFINQLVLRTDLSGDPTFRELLGRVRETALEAYAHQDLPFEKLVEAVQPERHLSRSPLFQTKLVLQNFPTANLHLREVTLTSLDMENDTSVIDLTLALSDSDDGLGGMLQYSTELFDESTVQRMLRHYETLLEAIAANPEQRISELPLLAETELQQLLQQSTGPRDSYPKDTCIHQLFEAQVERTPNAVAVVFQDREVSYRELNERANQLAHHLRTLGVGAEMLVGLCVERSVEMIVAVLGVLKAGAAFLPVDPSYPLERIAFMLEDAQVGVLVTEESLLDSLPSHWAQVVCLDTDAELIASQNTENPIATATADNLAYVIYTSGSTGKPKGVMIEHEGICNLATVQIKAFDMRPESRVLQFASLSFDASVWEIFMTLPAGGRLVLGRREAMLPGGELEALLRRHEITTATLPPTVLRVLDERQDKLKVVIAAGESLDKKTAERWRKRPNGRLIDAYGPTELTVCATIGDVETDAPTIGKPIANTEVYLLDARMQPVPNGVAGEMYLGGVGIARGYLNRPELTAERFVPNPFGGAGTRLYRTGDLGRWLANGEIDFLGRIDHQVKVRGYRIETGEIETVLNTHPEILTSLVTVREDAEKQLVAYCVPQHDEPVSTASLRTYLEGSLPEYMVPSVFVMLEEMPLTPNGKIDRKALPAPDQVKQQSERHFVAPRNGTEELLAGILSEVLKVPDVGIHDNFFELGGDSILSIQIIARANRAGLQLTTKQLFQYQTIAQLAAHAATTEAEEAILDAEPFAMISAEDRARIPAGIADAYPLAMMQTGMIFHSELTPEAPLYHSISTFNVRAPFDAAALTRAVADLAAIHEVMRTSFDLAGFNEPLQLVHEHVDVPVGVTDLRDLSEAEQEAALAQWLVEEQRSFSWGEVPLVRFHLHRRTDDTFQFTFTAHHAIFDGWSDGLFLTQLFQHYLTLIKASSAVELTPLASRYRDFVALERAALAAPDTRRYWQNLLRESKPTRIQRWPQSKTNGEQSLEVEEIGSGVVNTAAVKLDEHVSDGLRALARRAGVPLKSVLLAAHLRVLSAMSGERDVVTGLVSNGRPETTDGDRVIGLFLNTLPFRVSLDGGTWEELVTKTFRAEREMLAYRRYPLSQIQRENGGRTLFDTCFNYVHFHVLEELAGLDELEVLGTGGVADTNFALLVNFQLRTQTPEIDVAVSCDESKISAEQTRLIADYYQRLLEAMAEATEGDRYERYSILSDEEQHKLLVELNQTARAYPEIGSMQRLFEMQAEQTPTSVALICGDDRLTYRELNERANQLAHHLIALGVGTEQRVGILLERSTAMVVSMLAVLKAGGCYVPLDTQYPAERLAFMMTDAGLSTLLTTRALHESLKLATSDGALKVVCVDELSEEWARQPGAQNTENPLIDIAPQQLAYLIYTSGSTGVPKGVAIAHASATRFIQWASEIFEPEALRGVLCSTSICFDLSIFELFVTLSNGGKVILAENALELATLPTANEVTLINTVPSAMTELVRLGAVPQSVRVVNLAGEPLRKELVAEIYATTKADAAYNLYGPSEDTTYSTFTLLTAGERVTIGRPIANTRAYLLDENRQCVPLGVVGELYLGGAGLARGYWERPDLTAERFVPDSFSGEPGARLYRTGDLARYTENGELDFLGRADHQVKIRGYRIELGEIESALRSLATVRDAVVVANGAQQLVAYIIKATDVGAAELREQLRQHLPDYMIPSAFVMLEELPLTPNGKIDRKALPAVADSRRESVEPYVAPRDVVEFQLVKLWENLLRVRPIGVRDNFFALGGHSLVALRLVSRIEHELGKKIPVRALFHGATIESLATLLREGTVKTPRLVQLRSGHKPPLIFVHPAGGSIFAYLSLAHHLDPNQPLYALQASGIDDDEPAHETIEEMAADYISAIREAGIEGPYFLGGWSMGGVVAFEIARQLQAKGEEVAGLSLIDSAVPTPDMGKNLDDTALLIGFAQTMGLRTEHVDVAPQELAELNTEDKLALLLNWARKEYPLPVEVELADMQRYFNVYRANIRALARYSPQRQRVRITFFKADEHASQNGKDETMGWSALTDEKVELAVIPGDHYTLFGGPHIGALAEQLQAWLDKAEGVYA